MSVNGQNYFANMVAAPQILQGAPSYNVEVSEGQTPPGEFYPAQYLPIVQDEERIAGSGFVLMPGKVVAYDSNKRLIPAGLGQDFTNEVALATSGVIKYGALDTKHGVVAPDNAYAQADDFVAPAMIAAGITVTNPVGIMRYAALMAPGSNPSNPTTFTKHAYDTGGARAYSRWCYIQVPVVEINTRREACVVGDNKHRMRLYADESATKIAILDAGNLAVATCVRVASLNGVDGVAGDPTFFTVQGRTVLFNGVLPADWKVEYEPKVDLPFTCIKYSDGADPVVTYDSAILNPNTALLGQDVCFDIESNFKIQGTTIDANGYNMTVGRILDYKNGSNDDLKLVRTYFRDSGLWQEQPGSATDGRNTQLSIVNAPKWIARIAVNFESSFSKLPTA
jgi:hypothetical protein